MTKTFEIRTVTGIGKFIRYNKLFRYIKIGKFQFGWSVNGHKPFCGNPLKNREDITSCDCYIKK